MFRTYFVFFCVKPRAGARRVESRPTNVVPGFPVAEWRPRAERPRIEAEWTISTGERRARYAAGVACRCDEELDTFLRTCAREAPSQKTSALADTQLKNRTATISKVDIGFAMAGSHWLRPNSSATVFNESALLSCVEHVRARRWSASDPGTVRREDEPRSS
jgi:hypothetical protein